MTLKSKPIKNEQGAVKLIQLRNLVAHPSDIKQNVKNKIQFSREFTEKLLNLLTNQEPHLLKLICKVKSPLYLEDKNDD